MLFGTPNGNKVTEDDAISSTSSGKRKQVAPAKNWCFTWNNYPEEYADILRSAFGNASAYCWQEEVGENGTRHIQGCVGFKNKTRPSSLILEKNGTKYKWNAIHWESCRGTWAQNVQYCSKEGGTNTVFFNCGRPRTVHIIENLYPWQRKMEQILLSDPDPRIIYWLHEPVGNTGKTEFLKYMYHTYRSVVLGAKGKEGDLINLAYNTDWDVVNTLVIDLPRHNEGKLAFGAIESIKNGFISNTKYETGCKLFPTPHVVIVSNHPPYSLSEVSADRWRIYEIKNLDIPGLAPLTPSKTTKEKVIFKRTRIESDGEQYTDTDNDSDL